MTQAALKEDEEGRPRRLVDGECEKVVLPLFEEAGELAKENDFTHIFHIINKPASNLSSSEEPTSYSTMRCMGSPSQKKLLKASAVTWSSRPSSQFQ